MKKIKVAFATDDGKTFMGRHFGDAEQYYIYEIDNDNAEFIKKINNTTEEEEEIHADPKKAKGISNLLLNENVSVVVSKIFGPNIKRIRKKFVCILIKDEEIEEGINKVCANIEKIYNEWEKGEERQHLSF
ncbi:MAG: NifB/NifX family molybdenum-iron cluster-binding protein [Candidatus Tenebribacter burtonii]|jgi:predicted Fe-Mo cluster-binding NifX family protein|nr:NifB/NifX family molybdenum-iron cluster-binding protein [Candidatus Tenebribacter burtonii]